MSELNIPESWAEAKLENLVEILDNLRKPITAKDRKEGPYPYYGANGIQGYHDDFIFDDRLLLLAEDGGHFGSKTKDIAYIVEGKYWVNNHAHVLKNIEGVSLDFLFQYLRRFNVKPWVTGATVPKLNQAKTKELPVALPPYKEQVRIANKIESCFSKIEETEQNLNKVEILLDKYRESLLAKAFRGELIPQSPDDEPASILLAKIREERAQNQKGKKKEQEFSPISDEEKPFEIPENWEWVRLGELLSVSSGKMLSAKNQKGGSIPVYGGNGINGYHDEANLLNRSIIIGRVGAKCGVVHITEEKSWVTDNALIVDYIQDAFNMQWLSALLSFLNLNNLSNSSAQPVISGEKIYNVPIALAPPQEQKRIIEQIENYLATSGTISANINSERNLCLKLKEAILSKAFEGRLVDQIESEGTGHDLLEKIFAEKQSDKPEKKVVKKSVEKITKKVK